MILCSSCSISSRVADDGLVMSRATVVKTGRMVIVTLAALQTVLSTGVGKVKVQALRWIIPDRIIRAARNRLADGKSPFGSSIPPLASLEAYHGLSGVDKEPVSPWLRLLLCMSLNIIPSSR